MKNKILKFILIILVVMSTIYILRISFSEYNLKKTLSACILAQKQTSQSFDLEKAKKFCEEK
jgi:uncharacterized protein YpmB